MKRRDFVKSGISLSALAVTTGAVSTGAVSKPMVDIVNKSFQAKAKHNFKLKYAPHFGMFENMAGKDPIDQLTFMAEQGFTALEDNGMMGRDVNMQEKIGNQLSKLGMEMGVFVVDKGGNGANTLAAGKPEYIDIFLDGCKRAVDVAKRVNAKWMTVVPGDFERSLPPDVQTGYVIEALRRGTDILEPHGLVMVLEALSDTPDLFLRNSYQTHLICKAVDSPSCKILYDIYHMQKNEGNLINYMDMAWDEIAYVQIGDNPGRKEPTTGEINFENVFKHLYKKGYKGIAGMEHGMSGKGKEGEQKLIDAYVEVDSFKV